MLAVERSLTISSTAGGVSSMASDKGIMNCSVSSLSTAARSLGLESLLVRRSSEVVFELLFDSCQQRKHSHQSLQHHGNHIDG